MLRIGPSSLRGLSPGSGLRSRRALGHYKAGELALLAFVVLAVSGVCFAAAGILAGWGAGLPPALRWAVLSAAGAAVLCVLYARLVESRRLTVRRVGLASPKVRGGPLRLLHVSDLHVERWGRLEESVVRQARELRPDLVLMSGDYSSFGCRSEDLHRLIAELSAVAPTFACRGNGDYRPPPVGKAFEGTAARLLCDETVEVEAAGTRVSVTGIEPGNEEAVLSARDAGPDRFSVCLYHYPDLVPRISETPFDLMLCGHTHGGQVRFPFVGALVSLSRVGTRYCRGLFGEDGRHAFVTQGVGCESYGIAPLRFLCPPEVVLLTVRPSGPHREQEVPGPRYANISPMMTILINAVVIALLVGAYFAWQSLQREPAKRWPKLAERLNLKYEGPPPRMTGPWKNRQVTVQPDGEKAVVTFPVRRPEGFRLEMGPREVVEKAAGIVVPDRLEFTEPSALAFNERFLVRCKPVEVGRGIFDHVMRARFLALGEFYILAEAGRFSVRLPLDSDAAVLRQIFDLASSVLDGVEG